MKRFPVSQKSGAGVSIVEVMVAVVVVVSSVLAFSASVQQASRVARTGKAFASASEMLQERIEAFRYTPTWSNVTTAAGIASLAGPATTVAANFPNVTETFTVEPYPAGSALVVTRSPTGTFTNNGASLGTTRCVKLTVVGTWTAAGSTQRTRQIATIIAKGGL